MVDRRINPKDPEHKKALGEIDQIGREIEKFIFGAARTRENLVSAFFTLIPYDDGRKKRLGCAHPLIMSPPGYGKTGSARILASTIGGRYAFIAGHPEMKISEIVGLDMYDQATGKFFFAKGPIFSHIVITDEINRIHPKSQAFNLQAMEERIVSVNIINSDLRVVENKTFRLTPIVDGNEDELMYFNIATGNPFEQEGTYIIPEAQLDRFSVFFSINLPDRREEKRIRLENVYGDDDNRPKVETVMDPSRANEIAHLIVDIVKMKDDDAMSENMMRVIENSRPHGEYEDKDTGELITSKREFSTSKLREDVDSYVKAGLSPRANFHYQAVARTRAFMLGRDYVTIDDIKYVARLVMTHRILLNREARPRGIKQHHIVDDILKKTTFII
jgi:MoxR-like ATPase